jgi:hypothetical protein
MDSIEERSTSRSVIGFALSAKNQMLCSWCGPVYVAGILIGLCLIAGFIPPPRANLTANEVVERYRSNTTGIRIGLFIAIASTSLYAPFTALISTQMLRIEGPRRPTLAYVQLVNGAIGSLVLMLAFMFMMVAAFDPGRPPEITKAINELGWITLVIPFPPFCLQYIAIGIATLQDPGETPVFARWVAYYNFWVAFAFIPTGFVGFFKVGPFAWHGLISFWLAVAVYAGWFIVMTIALRRAIRQETATT